MIQKMNWKRRGEQEVLQETFSAGVPYLTFPSLRACEGICHGFSTRLGGVSEGVAASMNFTCREVDSPENVKENYRRFAAALGVDPKGIVQSKQTHTINVRVVDAEDAGKGYDRERDYDNVDGLVTNVPGLTLVTHYADCVPLFFVDPVHRAIGLSHSGWRGTVKRMGRQTLRIMNEQYGTDPSDVIACVGPSICRDCYEVSEDVAVEFCKLLAEMREEGMRLPESCYEESALMDQKVGGKYQLDLWAANRLILLHEGVTEEHLSITDLCTCCNPSLLHSHRATNGRRGLLGAFLGIAAEV